MQLEIREWAERILTADTLEEKLLPPTLLTDYNPGPTLIVSEPTRPIGMGFAKHTKEQKLPPFQSHHNPDNRAACLHRFAGHELLAVEIMAHALLAFPDAPKAFRKGLAHTLKEEQGHVRLYMQRMQEMGLQFGDMPLYKYFWNHLPNSPIQYVSVMSLTFEQANLDFAPLYGQSFARVGDTQSAALMHQIFTDEVRHVSFGYSWLNKLKGPLSSWEAWTTSLPPKLQPKRAKGFSMLPEGRRLAGLPSEWITSLQAL